MNRPFRFGPPAPARPAFSVADAFIVAGLVAGLALVIYRLAGKAPAVVAGPRISLSYRALPWYALLSTLRMAAAYVLSLLFSLVYGHYAARNLAARRVLMPLWTSCRAFRSCPSFPSCSSPSRRCCPKGSPRSWRRSSSSSPRRPGT